MLQEVNINKKPNLIYLYIYKYKAYSLKLPINIPKKQRFKLRAYINFLINYNSTNIYQIWVPSQQKIIQIKNIIFNKSKFYNLSEFDATSKYNIFKLVEVIEFTHKIPFYYLQEADNNNQEFFKE